MVLLGLMRRELLIVVNHTVVNVGEPFFGCNASVTDRRDVFVASPPI